MQKAEQQLLMQTSNQILIQIRTMELNYFLNYFSQYNTLAGLIAGFQLIRYLFDFIPVWFLLFV